jgi:hypothetical protein
MASDAAGVNNDDACHAGTRGGWAVVGHQRTARGRVSAACDEIGAIDAVPLERRSVPELFIRASS